MYACRIHADGVRGSSTPDISHLLVLCALVLPYLVHLQHASSEALRVSLGDTPHNARASERDLRALGDEGGGRFNASRSDVLRCDRSLAAVDARVRPDGMAGELGRILSTLDAELSEG